MTKSHKTNSLQYQSEWWSIDLPRAWQANEDVECTSFQAEHSIGVLQISSARKPNEDVTLDDLNDFANDSRTPPNQLVSISKPNASGLYAEYREADLYWMKWWLKNGSVLIFITYNVVFDVREKEREAVESIVSSLEITGSQ